MRRFVLLLAVLLCFSACFAACGNNKPGELPVMTTSGAKPMDLTAITASDYISLAQYKGFTIEYLPGLEEKSDVIWEKIFFASTVLSYPEQQIEYYIDQVRAEYIFIASERGEPYEDVLEIFGVTDDTMLKQAQYYTKADLVRRAIIEAEGIVLTEEDKTQHTDKYIKKFVDDYGYDESYVRENLMNELYDVMLEDKMMERLLMLNTFIEVGGLESTEGEHDHEH